MYFWDPNRGKGRRALIGDKINALGNAKRDAERTMVKDARNRLAGLFHRVRQKFDHEAPGDVTLTERVRSRIGHVISHPGALQVDACGGTVRVSGPILASEKDELIKELWQVEGVEAIEHMLEVHDSPDHIPALQGALRPAEDCNVLTDQWKPAVALAMSVAGGLLTLYGLSRKGPVGASLGVAGMGMIAKSFTDVK
jgi:hypothetical protein